MEIQNLFIYIIVIFIFAIALITPYSELGNKIPTYEENVTNKLNTYNSKLIQLEGNSQSSLNDTKQIKPLFTSLTESFDRLGSLIQASYDTIGKTTTIIDNSKDEIIDMTQKSRVPQYFIIGLIAIITIFIIFGLIKLIKG